MKKYNFLTTKEAVLFLVKQVESSLVQDISVQGQAALVLTGGSTIIPFLECLAKMNINWSKVSVILSDERWVGLDDDQSNEKQFRNLFLNKLPSKVNFISLKTQHDRPEQAISLLLERIKAISLPISCGVLSMGDDGHVASLFPDEIALWENLDLSVLASYVKGPRISLGLNIFSKIKHNFILCKKDRDDSKLCLNGIINNYYMVRF